jgi:GT2 family glycosyltransferase
MSKLGLVTVLYKADDVLEGFLRTVYKQDFKNYVLYLIDNSSNNKTNELVAQLLQTYPIASFQHIHAGGNIGVAAGNNLGIQKALVDQCDDVILLNNDIELVEDFVFSKMLSIAQQQKEVIIIPKILYFDSRKVWMAGGYMDNYRALGVHYEGDDANAARFNVAKHITYAPTCFMFIKRKVVDQIGIMDEKYFAYCDDTDFVYRAIQANFKLYYEPSLTILHKVSSSSGGDNSLFYIYYSNRNKIYFIRKNYKGLRKYFAIGYTLLARSIFYLRFDKERKAKLITALRDGFKMKI